MRKLLRRCWRRCRRFSSRSLPAAPRQGVRDAESPRRLSSQAANQQQGSDRRSGSDTEEDRNFEARVSDVNTDPNASFDDDLNPTDASPGAASAEPGRGRHNPIGPPRG